MIRIEGAIRPLARINAALLGAGRAIGILAVAVMVAVTILQVVCRYLLGSALAWPDEAARFCMLWMTGLMAPTALRRGGFVAIDVLPALLPATLGRVLNLVLLALSLVVLVVALRIGIAEVTGIGGRFASASLYLPTGGDGWYRVPRSWMMASLPVGLALMIPVVAELMLRDLAALAGAPLPPIAGEGGLRGVD